MQYLKKSKSVQKFHEEQNISKEDQYQCHSKPCRSHRQKGNSVILIPLYWKYFIHHRFFALLFISKTIPLNIINLDYWVFGCPSHFVPSCPAGWLFSSPHHPVLRTGGERGGASSQHCSCTIAREEKEGGGGTERTGGRGGVQRLGTQPSLWPGAL